MVSLSGILVTLLTLAAAILTLGALLALGLSILLMVRGSPTDGCPACRYGGRPTDDRPCTECGRTLPRANAAFWRSRLLQSLLSLIIVGCGIAGSAIAISGVESFPSWILARFADPLARPGSFAESSSNVLNDRAIAGTVDPALIIAVMSGALNRAVDDGTLFQYRPSWPVTEPVRIGMRRATLNQLRSSAKLELVLVAPDGEERIAARWGGLTRGERAAEVEGDGARQHGQSESPNETSETARGGPEVWAWRDRTIPLPESMRHVDALVFDLVLRERTSGGEPVEHYRRAVRLASLAAPTPDAVVEAIDDPATLDALRQAIRIRHSPVPRTSTPDASIILWIEPPLSLPAQAGLALRVTVEHLEEPAFRTEALVYVTQPGGLLLPSQAAPLALEVHPVPQRVGRCRVRIEGDAIAALRDLAHTRYVGGEFEFEVNLKGP